MESTQEQEFYAEVLNAAWNDANFKKELIADPVAAIEKLTGKKVNMPAGKTLVVRDQTNESVVYINIPATAKAINEDVELSEEQLEAVAGGCQWGDSGNGGSKNPLQPYIDSLNDLTLI